MTGLSDNERRLLQAWGRGVRAREYAGSTKGYESFRAEHPEAPTLEALYLRYGTWEKVRAAVRLRHGGGRRSDRDLAGAKRSMQRYLSEVGPIVTGDRYEAWARETDGVLTKSQMRRLLGAQWLRKAAAMVPELKMSRAREIAPGPELEQQLREVCQGRRLSRRQYDQRRRERHSDFASGTAISRAYAAAQADGRRCSWHSALDAAGIK